MVSIPMLLSNTVRHDKKWITPLYVIFAAILRESEPGGTIKMKFFLLWQCSWNTPGWDLHCTMIYLRCCCMCGLFLSFVIIYACVSNHPVWLVACTEDRLWFGVSGRANANQFIRRNTHIVCVMCVYIICLCVAPFINCLVIVWCDFLTVWGLRLEMGRKKGQQRDKECVYVFECVKSSHPTLGSWCSATTLGEHNRRSIQPKMQIEHSSSVLRSNGVLKTDMFCWEPKKANQQIIPHSPWRCVFSC